MFKKKIAKRNNVVDDLSAAQQSEDPQQEPEDAQDQEALEPKLRKFVKKDHMQVFSVTSSIYFPLSYILTLPIVINDSAGLQQSSH